MKENHFGDRKGQSAIEYLTTYGWALLAIVIVGAVLTSMGVFNQCSTTSPRFGGGDVSIDNWAYTNSSGVQMSLRASQDRVNVTAVKLNYDDGWYNATGVNTEIAAGSTSSFTVSSLDRTAGTCASADVVIEYNLPDSDLSGLKAAGSGSLRGQVPA